MSRVRAAARWVWHLPRWIGYFWGPRALSWFRKRWVLFRNPHADIRFTGPVYIGRGFDLYMPHGGTFIVGSGVDFRKGFRAEFAGPEATIRIGDGCTFTIDCAMACSTTIEIGDRVPIGQACFIADGNHRFREIDKLFFTQGYDFKPIKIGDDAVIHSKVTIVDSIGERSVIGANAVITKPIPPYCVAAGVPAKVLDYFGPPGGEPEGWAPRAGHVELADHATESDPAPGS